MYILKKKLGGVEAQEMSEGVLIMLKSPLQLVKLRAEKKPVSMGRNRLK